MCEHCTVSKLNSLFAHLAGGTLLSQTLWQRSSIQPCCYPTSGHHVLPHGTESQAAELHVACPHQATNHEFARVEERCIHSDLLRFGERKLATAYIALPADRQCPAYAAWAVWLHPELHGHSPCWRPATAGNETLKQVQPIPKTPQTGYGLHFPRWRHGR